MRTNNLIARFGVIVAYAAGFQVLYMSAAAVVGAIVSSRPVPVDLTTRPYYVVIANGKPLLTKSVWTQDAAIVTTEDQPAKLTDKQPVLLGTSLSTESERRKNRIVYEPPLWQALGIVAGRNHVQPWYFIQERDQGEYATGYLVNYSKVSLAPISYMGANGPSATVPARDQKFQFKWVSHSVTTEEGDTLLLGTGHPYWSESTSNGYWIPGTFYLVTPQGLQKVNLASREVSQVLAERDLQSLSGDIAAIYDAQYDSISQRTRANMLLRGTSHIYVLKNYQVAGTFLIPEQLRERTLQVYVDSGSIFYATSDRRGGPAYEPEHVFQCDADGKITKEWDISQPPEQPIDQLSEQLAVCCVCPAPMTIPGIIAFETLASRHSGPEIRQRFGIAFILLLVAGVLCIVAAQYLTPRYIGTTPGSGWLLFIFITGLPGLVAYLMHFRHRVHPVLAPAPMLGTEIFA